MPPQPDAGLQARGEKVGTPDHSASHSSLSLSFQLHRPTQASPALLLLPLPVGHKLISLDEKRDDEADDNRPEGRGDAREGERRHGDGEGDQRAEAKLAAKRL